MSQGNMEARIRIRTRKRSHATTWSDYMALDRFIVFIVVVFCQASVSSDSFIFRTNTICFSIFYFTETTPCLRKYRIWHNYQMMRVIFSEEKKPSHQRYETTKKNRSNNHHTRNLAPNWFETSRPMKTKWCWNFKTEFSTLKRGERRRFSPPSNRQTKCLSIIYLIQN